MTLEELNELEKRANDTIKGFSRSYIEDAQDYAKIVKEYVAIKRAELSVSEEVTSKEA